MTFEQYWTIMVKRWQIAVICFVLVGLGTYIGTKLMIPLYQSSALVQVSVQSQNNQADYNSLLASDQLVQTEAQLAVSYPVLSEVATHYKGMTSERLLGEVTATAKLNTQLFEIDVLDPNPLRAAAIATDVAATLINQQQQTLKQNNALSQQQIQQNLTSTQQQIDATTIKIANLETNGGGQGKIAVVQAQLNGLQQYKNQWQTILTQLELTQAQNGNFLRIAQPAQPRLQPVHPNVQMNTSTGFLAGAFLGIFLAIVVEFLDTRVRTPEELSRLLNWPVLATVWKASKANKENVIDPSGQSANSESYRILRTNVGFSSIDKPLSTLMVTSSLPGDGKSVIASNLAIFMAKAGKNTLLIDTDLRRPTLHIKFGLPGDRLGLSNAVLALSMPAGKAMSAPSISPFPHVSPPIAPTFSFEQYTYTVGIPNLRVMPSGPLPPNPSELLDSKAMDRLITSIASYGAEIVIFDTPPILGLSDASIMASKVDGVLVVTDITRANKKNLKQVKSLLTQAGARVLGCVVNKERSSRHNRPYSYYYQQNEQNAHKKSSRASEASSAVLADALHHAGKQSR